jgi:hypothetical protein
MNAALVLADAEISTDTITPGVLGFIVVALVGFALYLLMKNMRKQLGSVDFDEGPAPAEAAEPAEPAAKGSPAGDS